MEGQMTTAPQQNIPAAALAPAPATSMVAMVLHRIHTPLVQEERPLPTPGPGEIRVRVEACAVCRTDLHVVDGELPDGTYPIVPGHEIVGRIEAIGPGVTGHTIGARVGIPWLCHTCGHCPYCEAGHENLCDHPEFTGFTRDGGFATHVVADASYAFPLDGFDDPVEAAPLMCAGLIGWRSLRMAGDGKRIGFTALARRRICWRSSCTGRGARSMPSPARAIPPRRTTPAIWARSGPAPPRTPRPSFWTPRSSSPLSARWCRWR